MKKSAFLLILLLVTACSGNNKSKLFGEINSGTTIINLKDFDENKVFKYSDVYSDVEYVPLECTEKSIVGSINKFEITNDNDYVIFDYSNGQIIRFDKKGKYLNNIGTRGHGTNEYVSPEIVVYNKYTNQVVVYDGAVKSLKHFSLDGKLQEITKLSKYIYDFGVIDSANFVIFANHRDLLLNDEIAYNYEIINKNGDIVAQYEPYTKDRMNYRSGLTKSFFQQEDGLTFIECFLPVIYKLDKDYNVLPAYYMDFGDREIPQEWLECENVQETEMKIHSENSNVAYCNFFYESTNKYILSVIMSDSRIVDLIIDKNSKKIINGNIKNNDIYGIMTSVFEYYNNNKIYGIISHEFAELKYSELSDPKRSKFIEECYRKDGYTVTDKDKKILYKCSTNNNPIIQICTLK